MAILSRRLLRLYKPLDTKLRSISAYARLSKELQRRYNAAHLAAAADQTVKLSPALLDAAAQDERQPPQSAVPDLAEPNHKAVPGPAQVATDAEKQAAVSAAEGIALSEGRGVASIVDAVAPKAVVVPEKQAAEAKIAAAEAKKTVESPKTTFESPKNVVDAPVKPEAAPAKQEAVPAKAPVATPAKPPAEKPQPAAAAAKPDITTYAQNLDRVAPRADTILFECYWGRKYSDNPLAMYRQLLRDHPQGSFRIFWTSANFDEAPEVIRNNPDVTLVKPGTAEYAMALLTAGYLVNNVTFPTYFIRHPAQRYCNTWHGVPMKAMGRDMVAPLGSMANSQRNFLQSNILLNMGEYYRETTIQPYYVEPLVADNLFDCGAPRVDDLISPKIDMGELRGRYSIADRQKVVLFAPTWRGNSLAVDKGAADVQTALALQIAQTLGNDYFVLFSAHQMAKVPAGTLAQNCAVLHDDENINDILTIVDIMVSDYSSIIFDFLPIDRPIVLFTPDIDDYRINRGLYIGPDDLPCANSTTLAEMIEAIRAARRPSSFAGYKEMRERFAPLEDGRAAKKALSALLTPNMAVKARSDRRIRLLITPGGMMSNGITASLKSLIANLDYERFDPYIVVDAATMDREKERMEHFGEFDPRCNWLLRYGAMVTTKQERAIFDRFDRGETLDPKSELPVIRRLFQREGRRVWGDASFDVAIEFGGYSPFWASLIACSGATRKVCYQHNHLWAEFTNTQKSHRQLNGVFQIYHWFDQVVAVSDEICAVNEEHLKQFYPPQPPRSVRNTLNVKRVIERARVPVSLTNGQAGMLFLDPSLFRFVALGRLSHEKRFDRMIKALARIAPDYPNAVVMIGGAGHLKDSLTDLARRLGVTEQVRFLGRVSNPYPILANADVCLMSSDYEGQPITLLESLSLGTPCIGTDIPGIRSVLKDGIGHIVPANEIALADAMRAAIEGRLPELRKADIGASYVRETMAEFEAVVCGLTPPSAPAAVARPSRRSSSESAKSKARRLAKT